MKSIHSILSCIFGKSTHSRLSGQHRIFRGEFSDGDRTSYTYLKDANGERIFDGPFKYVYNDIYKQCLTGYFKNNRQVGKWICELSNTEYGHKTLVKTVITVNFNDEGLCHGVFTVSEYYRHGKVITTMKAYFQNGCLEGEYLENNRSRKGGIEKIRGSYRRGQPVGIWRFPEYTVDYDNCNDKGLPMAKIVDEATGDISYKYVEVRNSHYRPSPGVYGE